MQLLLWMAVAITAVGGVLVRVPMVVAVGYMSIIEASLWECFSWITILIPLLTLMVALTPLTVKSRWAWRIPLLAGVIAGICGVGMAVELWCWAYIVKGGGGFGFHPIGISIMTLLGLLFLSQALISRQVIRRRISLLEGRCLKCGYDLCATPDRCPECGSISPTGMLTARTP